ncbi:DUF6207 family protein [Streptomyces sp. NPDC052299]|uniref:DUF6207 family protein n=1 Tax=Streptomyces sp. NPDC052299 TaxID=3155054 RepID=UPI003416366F
MEDHTGYVDIVAADEAAVLQIAALLSRTWASSGPPLLRHVPEQSAFTGRIHLDTSLPAPGRVRVLPDDWVRYTSPPWGGRLDGAKPTCLRRRRDHRACERQAAEWPRGYGADDPGACWSHLSQEEREECLRVRQAYENAFWALKERHRQEAGHGRDERCSGCSWSPQAGPRPAF